MLWDLIRDYFVIHVFGGLTSTGENYGGLIGEIYSVTDDDIVSIYADSQYYFPLGKDIYGASFSITLGDWLSTTATIITLVIILVLCGLFIKKMVSSVANLMSR